VQCVVLAGGMATRMRPHTEHVPKALLPVAGRPFASHQLELLRRQGFTDVVYCIGHLGDQIRHEVGDGAAWDLRVVYSSEGDALRGTAGAIRLAAERGLVADEFAILYGDSYLPIDTTPVWEAFHAGDDPALMTVLRNEGRWDTSNVVLSGSRVVCYSKTQRNPEMHHIDYGLSIMRRAELEHRVPPAVTVDLAAVFEALAAEGLLAAWEVRQRFYEIGSPSGLADLDAALRTGPLLVPPRPSDR
jgi:NDP-sugar pyrophosphorylase family protein